MFEKFKEFKALIENLSDKKINTLGSDNGGEYTSKEFEAFCKRCWNQEGTNYSLQSSIEWGCRKKNKTIMEVVKTMIYDQDLQMHLWEEAARTAVYVQNTISHSVLGFKTPEEMYTGKKPEVRHLNIFGFPVYVHIPKEKRTKLDPL